MKKVMRIMGLVCMAGLLAFTTSCKKKENTTSLNLTVPTMSVVSVDGERAYIDGDLHFQWNEEDYIYVYNLSDVNGESVVNVFENSTGAGPTATFHGSEMGAPKFYGYRYFYPTTMVSGDPDELDNNNRQTFTVDHMQQFEGYEIPGVHPASAVDVDQMAMAINTDDLHAYAQLKHIFGIADIRLKTASGKDTKVQKITITDNVYNLWGTASLKLHAVDMDQLNTLMAAYKAQDPSFAAMYANYVVSEDGLGWLPGNNAGNTSIEMDCTVGDPAGVALPAGFQQYQDFMFLLRPLALSQGFTVDVEYTTGGVAKTKQITSWGAQHPQKLQFCSEPGVIKMFTCTTSLQ